MSIASEITRLQTAKAELKASINAKGGTINDETLDQYASVIDTISTGTDISDANAVIGDVLTGKTFYATSGGKKTGTMADNGTVNTDITTKAQEVTIAGGKHSGSGKVKISSTEQAKIVADNIKSGVSILGQAGSLTPAKAEETKTVTPNFASGNVVVTPTSGKVLSQVTINKDTTNHIAGNIKKDITLYGVAGTYEGGGVTFSGYSISLDEGGYGYAPFEANILGEYDGSYGWHYINLRSGSGESGGFTVSNASLLVIKYVASIEFSSGLGNLKTYDGTSISTTTLSSAVNKLCYLTGNVSLLHD